MEDPSKFHNGNSSGLSLKTLVLLRSRRYGDEPSTQIYSASIYHPLSTMLRLVERTVPTRKSILNVPLILDVV